MQTETISLKVFILAKAKDYAVLTKLRLSILVVFSAAIGYLLALKTAFSWADFSLLCLGGFLVTGASGALNQVLEKDLDKMMARTADRPLPTGRMSVTEASLAAGIMSVSGIIILSTFNPLTAFLGAISLLSYVFVYTPLKRISPIAVLVGAFPGALPTIIGWAAVTGTLSLESLSLFAIQFFWQFTHFWAIAWVAYDSYASADIYLLPTGKRDKSSAMQILFYTFCLVLSGVFPYILGISGLISAIVITIVALYNLWAAYRLYQERTPEAAKKLMFAALLYLPIVQIALVLDKV